MRLSGLRGKRQGTHEINEGQGVLTGGLLSRNARQPSVGHCRFRASDVSWILNRWTDRRGYFLKPTAPPEGTTSLARRPLRRSLPSSTAAMT